MGPIALATVRGQINDNIVTLVRREVEQTEVRLKTEIARLRDTVALTLEKNETKSDKVAAVVNHKMVIHETAQTKLEKTVSALSGSVQGLSGVVQEQIQRAHGVDSRIWEMRHQLEDIFVQRCGELDKQHQDGQAKWRASAATMDDLHKQHHHNLKRLEDHLQDLASAQDHHSTSMAALSDRLAQAEETTETALQAARDAHAQGQARAAEHAQELATIAASQSEDGDARLWKAEQQLEDLDQRVSQISFEAHSDKGWESTMKVHEVKLNNMRSKVDGLEEHCQGFDDRVRARSDMESRIVQMQKAYQELANKNIDDQARVDAVASRMESMDQCLEEMRQEGLMMGNAQMPYLQATLESLTGGYSLDVESHFCEPAPGSPADTRDMDHSIQQRLDTIQDVNSDPMQDVPRSARSHHSEGIDGAHVGDLQAKLDMLIAQLREMMPKVREHDELLKKLPGVAEAAERAAEEAKALAQEAMDPRHITPRGVVPLPVDTQTKLVEDCTRHIMGTLARSGTPERQQLEGLLGEVVNARRASANSPPRSGSESMSSEAIAKVEHEVNGHLQLQQQALQKLQEAVSSIGSQLKELRDAVDGAALGTESGDYDGHTFNTQLKTAIAELAACNTLVAGSGGTGAAPPPGMDDDITHMYSRVEESERVAQDLQLALKERIRKMEALMDAVQDDMSRPAGTPTGEDGAGNGYGGSGDGTGPGAVSPRLGSGAPQMQQPGSGRPSPR